MQVKNFCFLLVLLFSWPTNLALSFQVVPTDDDRQLPLNENVILVYLKEPTVEFENSVVFTFRNIRWGMTKDEVKSSEPWEELKEYTRETGLEVLLYRKWDGSRTPPNKKRFLAITYVLSQGKLVLVRYLFNVRHNRSSLWSDFSRLKTIFTDRYGEPLEDEEFGSQDLSYWAKWSTPDTDIALSGNRGKDKIALRVEFSSKNLSAIEKMPLK